MGKANTSRAVNLAPFDHQNPFRVTGAPLELLSALLFLIRIVCAGLSFG
jgi:hypothetical protein